MDTATTVSTASAIWSFINSPAVLLALAMAFAWIVNKIYTKAPWVKAYSGTFIAAVRWAEKAIPDSTASSGMRKLDEALKFALNVIAADKGVAVEALPSDVIIAVREAIQVTHDKVEATGGLDVVPEPELETAPKAEVLGVK